MKKSIMLMCAMLLIVTSCRSTQNMFKQTEVQQNISIEENNYNMAVSSIEGKKSSYVYNSMVKTGDLPINVDVTKTVADLQVSSVKIEYTCAYCGDNDAAGRKAAVNYAITQALKINGNADVLLEPQYEIKAEGGQIKSVKVSGYAATYCNFRTATEKDLKMLKEGNPNALAIPKMPQKD